MTTSTGRDYVRAFGQAADQVMQAVLSETPARGTPVFQMGATIPLQAVNGQVGQTGNLIGHVDFGINEATVKGITGIMMMEPGEELDELANSGNARTYLHQLCGFADITPPTVRMGESIISTSVSIRATSVPLTHGVGQQDMIVEAVRSGAKDFIVKPVQIDRVVAAIQGVKSK